MESFIIMIGKPFQFPVMTSQAPIVLFEPGLRGGIYSIVRNETVQTELGINSRRHRNS